MKLTITESFLYNDFELLFAAEDEDGNHISASTWVRRLSR